jgi:hypothetical protein
MEQFLNKYNKFITGILSCFDRLMFKGHLPLAWSDAMERLLTQHGLLIKDFKDFVTQYSGQIIDHAKAMAEQQGRPSIYLDRSGVDKDDLAKKIAKGDGISEGLVCILRVLETCSSFRLTYGDKRPRLMYTPRRFLCLYFYYMDREFGLIHVRLETWFPLRIQICLNGHNWLAHQLDKHGIRYRRLENAFLWIEDPDRAQKLADKFIRKKWHRVLQRFALRVNPLLRGLLRHMRYYWVIDQAEFATDVMFPDRATLKPLYEVLLRHALLCFRPEDILTFLGRKLHGAFKGEVLTEYRTRWPGARIKHRMKENWIKMYDKFGSVLRIETVVNNPREFKVRRWGTRKGEEVLGWFPMAKGVANMYRYAKVARSANHNYLTALSQADSRAVKSGAQLRQLANSRRRKGRGHRGFNPASSSDVLLFAAVLRAEHHIHGFRNQDIRTRLLPAVRDQRTHRRQSARVSRILKRLHVHGLIAKIPRSRRWRVTAKGNAIMTTTLKFHHDEFPQLLALQAA